MQFVFITTITLIMYPSMNITLKRCLSHLVLFSLHLRPGPTKVLFITTQLYSAVNISVSTVIQYINLSYSWEDNVVHWLSSPPDTGMCLEESMFNQACFIECNQVWDNCMGREPSCVTEIKVSLLSSDSLQSVHVPL